MSSEGVAMTMRVRGVGFGVCLLTIALASLLLAPGAQAKKGAGDKNHDSLGMEGERERPTRELPAAALFGRVSSSIVVVEVVLDSGKSQGSGVVIGHERIVTNSHVVAGSRGIQVRQGSRSWPATIEALSLEHDLALLHAKDLDLPRVSMRASTLLTVGERVYAVGAPRGLELSLSDGLIAALRRDKSDKSKKDKTKESDETSSPSLIQTTAATSPGSSGGGLFDGQGRLVGIITFLVKGGQNLNFAHPTEWVEELRSGKPGHESTESNQAPPAYGLTQRPSAIKCDIDSRAVWGLFSGGAEILENKPVKFEIRFDTFDGQTPTFLNTIEYQPRKGDLVLADLNREAGFIHFTSTVENETDLEYFFSVDDDGRFRLTVAKPFKFHGQMRVLAMSGACQARDKIRPPNPDAKGWCKQGDIRACLSEGAGLEETDRAGALSLYLKGCSQSGVEDATLRSLVADACTNAARVADAMGASARAEGLRKQAAQMKTHK
jgi:hypothetical protein